MTTRHALLGLAIVAVLGVLATGNARSQATGAIVIEEERIIQQQGGDSASDAIIDDTRASDLVRVEDVRVAGGTLEGRVVNDTPTQLTDVRLLVRHEFRWNDEMHPGENSPGRSSVIELATAIPPGQTLKFAKPITPLPMREDGSFTTEVKLLGFTQVGAAGDGAPAAVVGRR